MRSLQSTLVAVIAVPVVLACAGGRTGKLEAMPSAPAAVGEVKTSRGENDNTEVKVEVEHLARFAPYFVMLPHLHGTDGFFAAVLERIR